MTKDLSDITVPRTRIPSELEIHEELGKGSNNKVFSATYAGHDAVFRVPRRRSDTQQSGNALWEHEHMKLASECSVAPTIYTVWYARHATREWPSGLYVVMERFDNDMETVICKDRDAIPHMVAARSAVEAEIVRCLSGLARAHLFVYDLKPSNMVMRFHGDGGADVRIIDFGRDFCECILPHPTQSSPHIDMLRRRICKEDGCVDGSRALDERVSHVLFAVMMVILSSTTTRCLYEDRGYHRLTREEREDVHPLCRSVRELLGATRDRDLTLVRALLRMDEVRGVLRHYHGRRNAGTGRTLRFAAGVEDGCA